MTEAKKEPTHIKISVDRNFEVESLIKEKEALAQKVTEKDEIIKSMLIEDKEKLEAENKKENLAKGDTTPITNEPNYQEKHIENFDFDEESEILFMNPKFPSPEEAISYIKKCASNPLSGDYNVAQKLYGKAIKKALREGGTFEFCGNMARWERRGDKIVKGNRPQTFRRVEDE